MFSRISIRNKIVAVIAFLFSAMTFMGLFSFVEMRAINQSTHEIQATWLPGVRWLAELRIQSSRYRAILRDDLLLTDPQERGSIIALLSPFISVLGCVGLTLLALGKRPDTPLHYVYGFGPLIVLVIAHRVGIRRSKEDGDRKAPQPQQ